MTRNMNTYMNTDTSARFLCRIQSTVHEYNQFLCFCSHKKCGKSGRGQRGVVQPSAATATASDRMWQPRPWNCLVMRILIKRTRGAAMEMASGKAAGQSLVQLGTATDGKCTHMPRPNPCPFGPLDKRAEAADTENQMYSLLLV